MIDPRDHQFIDGLRRAGAKPPYGRDELALIETLEVLGHTECRGIDLCTRLRTLTLFAIDATNLDFLRGMTHLEVLRLGAIAVDSLEPIRELQSLTTVQLNFTLVTDASPLQALPALRRLDAFGTPLSDASYRALASAGVEVAPEGEVERRIGLELRRRGLQLAYGAVPPYRRTLVRLGSGVRFVADFVEIEPEPLADALTSLSECADTDELFYLGVDSAHPKTPPTETRMRRFLR